jgi:hypothetical protein
MDDGRRASKENHTGEIGVDDEPAIRLDHADTYTLAFLTCDLRVTGLGVALVRNMSSSISNTFRSDDQLEPEEAKTAYSWSSELMGIN